MQLMAVLGPDSKRSLRMAQKDLSRRKYQHWRNHTKESKIYLCTLFALCEGKCPECGKDMWLSFNSVTNHRKATLDHVDPISITMEHDKLNLKIMCQECNGKKANK